MFICYYAANVYINIRIHKYSSYFNTYLTFHIYDMCCLSSHGSAAGGSLLGGAVCSLTRQNYYAILPVYAREDKVSLRFENRT